jgi:tRNA A58 N-methylase Trm61
MQSNSHRDIEKKMKRGPQIITRKDAAIILAETGLRKDWKCLDLGGGSGFLSLFLSRFLSEGSMTVYEIKKEHYAIIEENVKKVGFQNVKVVNKPAEKFTGKGYDLITIDMKGAEKLAAKCHEALKSRGWLVIYSPHINQQLAAKKKIEKAGFRNIYTLETIQRFWKIDTRGFAHPEHTQLVHTGFITFARKD